MKSVLSFILLYRERQMARHRKIILGSELPQLLATKENSKKLSYEWDYWFAPCSDAYRWAWRNRVSSQTLGLFTVVPKPVRKQAGTEGNTFSRSQFQGTFFDLHSSPYVLSHFPPQTLLSSSFSLVIRILKLLSLVIFIKPVSPSNLPANML